MSVNKPSFPEVFLDGKWIPCLPAEEFGFLGSRLICELGGKAGQPSKKLLLREKLCDASAGESNPAELGISPISHRHHLGLRPLIEKAYRFSKARDAAKDKGSLQKSTAIFQQDISGLISLKGGIIRAVKDGNPSKVWELFYNACKALRHFGTSFGPNTPVPLQCPASLAVDSEGRIVPLDAEIALSVRDTTAKKAFVKWFGSAGESGMAHPNDAGLLHSKALLLYFRQLMQSLAAEDTPHSQSIGKISDRLAKIPPEIGVAMLQTKIQQILEEDWGITLAEEDEVIEFSGKVDVVPIPLAQHAEAFAPTADSKPRKSSFFQKAFFIFNLLLLALALFLLFKGQLTATHGDGDPIPIPVDTSVVYGSYCVVFPTQGTSADKVLAAINESFPGRVIDVNALGKQRRELLSTKLTQSLKGVKVTEGLKKLMQQLSEKSVRFKGFSPEESDYGLNSVIERGGIFSYPAKADKTLYASLLQSNGIEIMKKVGGVSDIPDVMEQTQILQRIIAEYASYSDALTMLGDRTGYILQVDPTVEAHEIMRRKLLGRGATPVFVPRPLIEMFDAVDPSSDTGGGFARFSLKLDQECFWRLVGKNHRKDIDFKKNESNNKMQWLNFKGNKEISWSPVSVLRQSGEVDIVLSFDIAVVLSANKVVVFRNQRILVGDSREQIKTSARSYLTDVLIVKSPVEEAIFIQQQKDQFTGSFLYSYLADQVAVGRNVEILTAKDFEKQRELEDAPVK